MYDPTPTNTTVRVQLRQHVDSAGNPFGRTDGTYRYWPDTTLPGVARVRWARIEAIKDATAITPTHGAAADLRGAVIAAHRSAGVVVSVSVTETTYEVPK